MKPLPDAQGTDRTFPRFMVFWTSCKTQLVDSSSNIHAGWYQTIFASQIKRLDQIDFRVELSRGRHFDCLLGLQRRCSQYLLLVLQCSRVLSCTFFLSSDVFISVARLIVYIIRMASLAKNVQRYTFSLKLSKIKTFLLICCIVWETHKPSKGSLLPGRLNLLDDSLCWW